MTRGTSGLSLRTPFAYYDRTTSCWRTWRATSRLGSTPFSATWPRSGTMTGGYACRLPGWVHRTGESASSSTPSLLPTPDVVEHVLPTPKIKDRASRGPGATGGPDLGESVALLNSPTSSEGNGVGIGRRKESSLRGQVDDLAVDMAVLPTPRTADKRTQRGMFITPRSRSGPSLEQALEVARGILPAEARSAEELPPGWHAESLLPTPAAARAGDTVKAHLRKKPGRTTVTNLEVMASGGLLPTPTAQHTSRSSSVENRDPESNGGPNQRGSAGDLALPSAALMLPTPNARDYKDAGASDVAKNRHSPPVIALLPTPDAQMGGAGGRSSDPQDARDRGHHVTINEVAQHLPEPEMNRWGPYEPAIRRWERVLGRMAPWATEPSSRSKKGRLAPRFVEWMMGWAEGWVTDVPRLSRNQQLEILGNGVVPQQAAEAVRFLLAPPPVREPVRRRPKAPKRPTARAILRAAMKESHAGRD